MKENLIRLNAREWVLEIITDCWDRTLKHPLYAAAFFLNPMFQYKRGAGTDPDLLQVVHEVFAKLDPTAEIPILLDAVNGIHSKKDSLSNETLKGFDIIDSIKEELEATYPGIVSCADILLLAAREGEKTVRLLQMSQHMDSFRLTVRLRITLASFASRGFIEKETVSFLGAHSIGVVHYKFFLDYFYNFQGK
ncbi:putative Peroxidase 48 [Vitis vinifera]|uniref:peroxidase n=1 Tax=Vitis vinifera TaxID=29760 RepID=A0A438FNN2_VITVI|nr:putative Peroxidase 48 [Vitis vinifera]